MLKPAVFEKKWFPIVFFILWGLLSSLQFYVQGDNSYIRVHDNGDSNHPKAYTQSHFPGLSPDSKWDHGALCGYDKFSTIRLYGFLQLIAPGWLGFAILMILQRIFAGLFMYLLVRKTLGQNQLVSFSAGLVYPFLIALTPLGIYHALSEPGLPFFIYVISELMKKQLPWLQILVSLVIGAFFAFSTSIFIAQPFMLLVFFYFFFFIRKTPLKTIIIISLPFFIAMLTVDAPTVLTAWEIKAGTNRVLTSHLLLDPTFGDLSFFILRTLKNIILRDSLLVLTCVLALFMGVYRNRLFRLTFAAFIFCSSLTYLLPWVFITLFGIDFFRIIQIDRLYNYYFFFLVISSASAAGFVVAKLSEKVRIPAQPKLQRLLIIGFLSIILGIFLLPFYSKLRTYGISPENDLSFLKSKINVLVIMGMLYMVVFMPVSVYSFFQRKNLDRIFSILVMLILPLYSMSNLVTRFASNVGGPEHFAKLFNHPEYDKVLSEMSNYEPYRVATAYPDKLFHPIYAQVAGLETVDSHGTLFPARYHLFWKKIIENVLSNSETVRNYFHISRGHRVYLYSPNLFGPPPPDLKFSDAFNLNLLSLANAKYFFSQYSLDDERLVMIDDKENDDLFVYRNEQVLPRFFLINDAIIFADSLELLDSLASADMGVLKSTAFLESNHLPVLPDSIASLETSTLTLDHYESDVIRLSVHAESDALLIVSNNWSLYWTARIDGSPAKVYPADFTFQCVYIPAGTEQVDLVYSR